MTRIALIEDNEDNRILVHAILEDLYEIEEYESGSEALAGLQANPPSLVLLDISLPAMDGTEVLRRLRSDQRLRTLPVIALTAHAMAGDRERFLSMGFDAYVTKPIIEESVLLAEIERLLNRTG
jgi:two-component system, cell cycle response regulator DivK